MLTPWLAVHNAACGSRGAWSDSTGGLGDGSFKVVKLSGGMSMAHRDKAISAFQNDPNVLVFLISLKAGGVALNLTAANHIFLMDPWWNPAAENQAIDRTHRLGQFKPIGGWWFVLVQCFAIVLTITNNLCGLRSGNAVYHRGHGGEENRSTSGEKTSRIRRHRRGGQRCPW